MILEIRSSMFKRIDMEPDDAHEALIELGFDHVDDAAGGRIHYHENEAGMSLTLVEGPRAVSIFPSGPIRGRLFGTSGLGFAGEDPIKQLEDVVDNNGNDLGSRGRTGNEVRA